jgi:hypothetical protein
MNTSHPTEPQRRLIKSILAILRPIGYQGELVKRDYGYKDRFSTTSNDRQISAALFGRAPVSYETALLGIVEPNGLRGAALVDEHRSLGAPMMLEVEEDHIGIWTVGRDTGSSRLGDTVNEDGFRRWVDDNEVKLRPDEFLRTKENLQGGPTYFQPSLFAGLIPELEETIARTLDPLLKLVFTAGITSYEKTTGHRPAEPSLFKLAFWLLTGKVFSDRGHPDFLDLRQTNDPDAVLQRVATHYNENLRRLLNRETREDVFNHIWTRMDFRNLSVEVLSQIWSRTLVTPETRKRLGIHRTRRSIVRYIIEKIPFNDFATEDRRVLELCTGSAAFLVGALDRMRDIADMHDPKVRHAYFQRTLKGIEKDSFGVEIARLCLALTDYPNANGWDIQADDVFRQGAMRGELSRATIVLCNPPFEKFTVEERSEYQLKYRYKPAELLSRVLDELSDPRAVLGFVLPRAFLDGQDYREIRPRLIERFGEIDLVSLPDKGWDGVGPETVLLTAKSPRHGSIAMVTNGVVRERNWRDFEWTHKVGSRDTGRKSVPDARDSLIIPELREVWEFLSYCPSLHEYAEAHKGVRWNTPIENNEHLLVSETPFPESRLGVPLRATFNSFERPALSYLNFEKGRRLFGGFDLPWDQPKVIMNKARRSRDMWRVAAFADFDGLACFETFLAVWPKDPSLTIALEVVLNSPIANAYLAAHCGGREFKIGTIHQIPFPTLSDEQIDKVNLLAMRYKNEIEVGKEKVFSDYSKASRLLREIDATILAAYGLPPRLERRLLDFFNESERLVPFKFGGYFPPEFKPTIPLSMYLAHDFSKVNARYFIDNIPSIDDPDLSDALSEVE